MSETIIDRLNDAADLIANESQCRDPLAADLYAAAELLARAQAVIEAVEWQADAARCEGRCPYCRWRKPEGHTPGCELGLVNADIKEAVT